MRESLLLLASTLVLACSCRPERSATSAQPVAEPAGPGQVVLDFQDMEIGSPPRGFSSALTGGGGPVEWQIVADPAASAGKVLAQASADDTDYRFPLCVLDGFTAKDVSVSVRFRAVAGEIDQAGGLVVRYRDADHYYIVRANALEDNVRLYVVEGGQRNQFAGVKHAVSAGDWHTLRLDAAGSRFAVFFDGELLFTAENKSFEEAGQIGLWTKADSVTWFDDLRHGPVAAESPVLAAPVR